MRAYPGKYLIRASYPHPGSSHEPTVLTLHPDFCSPVPFPLYLAPLHSMAPAFGWIHSELYPFVFFSLQNRPNK